MNIPPPVDLPEEARAKWCEIVGDLDDMTPLDLGTIRAYCLAHAEVQAALKLLAECPNPFILAGDGQPYVNPLRKIIDTARAQMARLRRHSVATTRSAGSLRNQDAIPSLINGIFRLLSVEQIAAAVVKSVDGFCSL